MNESVKSILCYGDSNTHGTCPMEHIQDKRRFGRTERWPGRLAAALGPGFDVIEEGHPGRTTVHPDPIEGVYKNGIAVLPAILETHCPIDGVVLMLGTNDLKSRFSVTPLDIALIVEELILTIAQSMAGPDGGAPRVLVMSPPPILEETWLGEMFRGGGAKSQDLAPRYAEVAARNGCTYFDAGTVIESDPLVGIHLSAAAHETLGAAMAEQVSALVNG